MTASENAPTSNKHKSFGRWLSLALKIVFFASAFVLVILTVMANMGGNNDNLRQAVEQFVGQNMGYDARVEKLNRLSFFPRIALDFENIALFPAHSPSADPVVTAGRSIVSFSFWDVFLGNGKMQIISLRDIKALPGVWTRQAMEIRSVDIVDQTQGAALLKIEGHIGKSPFEISLDLLAEGAKGSRKYQFGPERGFKVALDGLEFKGRIVDSARGLNVQDFTIADGQEIAAGTLSLERLDDRAVGLTGDVKLSRGQAVLKPDLKIAFGPAPQLQSGTIRAENLAIEDLDVDAPLQVMLAKLGGIFLWDQAPFAQVRLLAADIRRAGRAPGSYDGDLPVRGYVIDAAALERKLTDKE